MLPRGEKSREAVAKERIVIYKNVLLIATAFMVLFTAYQSMAALQSSINKVEGLGSKSLATIYISLIVSSLFVPTWLIERLKAKWAMVLSMLCYSLYIAAQFYPSFYTLIPAAVIIGVGAAPLWTAKCAYLSQVNSRHDQVPGYYRERVLILAYNSILVMKFHCFLYSRTLQNLRGHCQVHRHDGLVLPRRFFRLLQDVPTSPMRRWNKSSLGSSASSSSFSNPAPSGATSSALPVR